MSRTLQAGFFGKGKSETVSETACIEARISDSVFYIQSPIHLVCNDNQNNDTVILYF